MPMKRSLQRGFSLIEVLIALVILAVGLLGMASLMLNSLQSSQSASMRSQASLYAYDIIERIRANPEAVTSTAYVLESRSTPTTLTTCSPCTPQQRATRDISEWLSNLFSPQAGIPGASASIQRIANAGVPTIFDINISWDESGQTGVNGRQSFNLRVEI